MTMRKPTKPRTFTVKITGKFQPSVDIRDVEQAILWDLYLLALPGDRPSVVAEISEDPPDANST